MSFLRSFRGKTVGCIVSSTLKPRGSVHRSPRAEASAFVALSFVYKSKGN
jgi:hypothetical protein